MTTQRDELAAEIADVYLSNMGAGPLAGKVTQFDLAEAILAAGYRKPRTITSVEELHGLPLGSVIIDSDPSVLQMLEKSAIGGAEWAQPNEERIYSSGHVTLPATVLYEPAA